MKKLYIPHGETVTRNSLYTDKIIVKGVLRVNGKVSAKEIVGGGIIEAQEIVCDDLHADQVTADFITAKRVAANKLFVQFECRASEAIAVKDFATAEYVSTGKLSVTLSDIQACDADEVVILKQKHSLMGLLWASWWRGLCLALFHGRAKVAPKDKPSVAIVETEPPASVVGAGEETIAATPQDTNAFDMLVCVLTEMRKQGYVVTKSNEDAA